MKTLIVGGGLGGMMLAASLQQRGIDYQLIEQSFPKADQGYSLGVWCNSRKLFQGLGLEGEFDRLGTRIHDYAICDCRGKRLKAFKFEPFYARYGMAYTQMNRHQLRELLASKADATRIRCGVKLTDVVQQSDRVEVAFSNGEPSQFDLVVGADGVHSLVREQAFGKSLETFTEWRAWYVWIDKRYQSAGGMTEYLGAGRCVGIFDDGERALAIFFSTCDSNVPDDLTGRIERLRELFPRELSCMPGALDGIGDDAVMVTDLASVELKQWVRGRVVLLGDAAHAFEPHTGLGASMAMEDAVVLSDQITRITPNYPLARALEEFQRLRSDRVALAQRLTKKIRRLAFIRSKAMRFAANRIIPFIPERMFLHDYFTLLDGQIDRVQRADRAQIP